LYSGFLEVKIKEFTVGDLVSIRPGPGEMSCGIVVRNGRCSMYDPSTPGRSFYVYSVLVEGDVQYVPEDYMTLQE